MRVFDPYTLTVEDWVLFYDDLGELPYVFE